MFVPIRTCIRSCKHMATVQTDVLAVVDRQAESAQAKSFVEDACCCSFSSSELPHLEIIFSCRPPTRQMSTQPPIQVQETGNQATAGQVPLSSAPAPLSILLLSLAQTLVSKLRPAQLHLERVMSKLRSAPLRASQVRLTSLVRVAPCPYARSY